MVDTLWLWDERLQRVTYVTSDGRYIDDESLSHVFAAPRDWGRFPPFTRVSHVVGIAGGEYLLIGRVWRNLPSRKTSGGPVVAVGSSRIINRVVVGFGSGAEGDFIEADVGARDLQTVRHPLRARPYWAIASDASRLAHIATHVADERGGHLQLTIVAASGDTLVSRRYVFIGEPRPARVADSIVASRLQAMRVAPRQYEALRQAIAGGSPQPVYPPVQYLVVSRDSTTWIGLRQKDDQRTWLVLDAAGEPIGELALPADHRIVIAERRTVWCIHRDDDDVRSVVRLAVTGW